MKFDRTATLTAFKEKKPALKKDFLLKKLGAAELLEALQETLENESITSVDQLMEELDPVCLYPLALLLREVAVPTTSERKQAKALAKKDTMLSGSVKVDGELIVFGKLLVVGDLEADGVVVEETGCLAVGGNVKASVVGGDGWLLVSGDVDANLVCGYYEAGEFGVSATLRSELAVFSNHGAHVANNEAPHFFKLADPGPKSKKYLELENVVAPGALVPEGDEADLGVHRVDFRKLMKLARAKKPILRRA